MQNQVPKYLKVYLHNECNFQCICCQDSLFKDKPVENDLLKLEDLAKLVDGFARLGVEHVRIIGKEPLLRDDIFDFIHIIRSTGRLKQVSLTTNGYFLKDKALALKGAGLDRINIYLSSLNNAKFKKITGVDGLGKVMEGICAANEVNLTPIRINVFLVKGLNSNEAEDFAALSMLYPMDVRFIESGPNLNESYVPGHVVKNNLEFAFGKLIPDKSGPLEGPAKYYRIKDAKGRIGFINFRTELFCVNCNTFLLHHDGRLFPCLYSSFYINLAEYLRQREYKELAKVMRSSFSVKPRVNKYTTIENLQPTSFN
jgi:cyclic pyranopterin phosphate synthase